MGTTSVRQAPMTVTPGRALVWAVMSCGLFVAALFATLPIIAVASSLTSMSHLAEMAAWSVAWGCLSLVGVLVAARLAFGAWLPVHPAGITVAVVGIAVSAIVHVVLQQWEIARFGIPEPEYVGWTAGLFAVLVGLAVAGFAALVAPSSAWGWPAAAVVIGAAGVSFIILSNVPGLADGIKDESWPLAIWVGLSGVYALAVTGLVIARRGSR